MYNFEWLLFCFSLGYFHGNKCKTSGTDYSTQNTHLSKTVKISPFLLIKSNKTIAVRSLHLKTRQRFGRDLSGAWRRHPKKIDQEEVNFFGGIYWTGDRRVREVE